MYTEKVSTHVFYFLSKKKKNILKGKKKAGLLKNWSFVYIYFCINFFFFCLGKTATEVTRGVKSHGSSMSYIPTLTQNLNLNSSIFSVFFFFHPIIGLYNVFVSSWHFLFSFFFYIYHGTTRIPDIFDQYTVYKIIFHKRNMLNQLYSALKKYIYTWIKFTRHMVYRKLVRCSGRYITIYLDSYPSTLFFFSFLISFRANEFFAIILTQNPSCIWVKNFWNQSSLTIRDENTFFILKRNT